jgi:hypothetical protein
MGGHARQVQEERAYRDAPIRLYIILYATMIEGEEGWERWSRKTRRKAEEGDR